jgi:MFS family permease
MNEQPAAAPLTRYAVFLYVFVPFALSHFMSLLLRNINAVLAPHLISSLALTPGDLGLLTGVFYLAFVVAQLPVGTALDRYGPRKVQLVLLLMAAAGALLFAHGNNFADLLLARAVMGFGVGGTLMGAVKAMSNWMAPDKMPTIHGYLIAAGGLGAASATMPMRMVLQYADWRGLLTILAAATAAVALLIWAVTPRVKAAGTATLPSMSSLVEVCRDRAFRRTTALVLVPHCIVLGIQGLWIGRWLADLARFPDSAIAYLLYLSMASVIFGAIAVGFITEWAGRRGVGPLDVAAVGVGIFLLVQFAMVLNYRPGYQLLAVLFSLVGTITGIEYTIIAQSMPPELAKRGTPCLNMLIFGGAFLAQAGFGLIVGQWHPDPFGRYPAIAYQVGFGAMIALQLPGLIHYVLARRPARRAPAPSLLEEGCEANVVPVRNC